ncbi:hypothetical protein CP8484711_0817B, partial [Chlamydia psittaci 84-8471/1]
TFFCNTVASLSALKRRELWFGKERSVWGIELERLNTTEFLKI